MRRFSGSELVLATHNQGKVEEFETFLAPLGIKVLSAAMLGLDVPRETEDSFAGNARIKAHAAVLATGLPALADDSGIAINALNGAPGVYTADWAETEGGRDFMLAMTKAWGLIQETKEEPPFAAQFRCTLVLAWPDGHDEVVEGSVDGCLVWPIRGALGHGYDPMFQPTGSKLTFAEMDSASKNALSHRARAIEKLIANCFT